MAASARSSGARVAHRPAIGARILLDPANGPDVPGCHRADGTPEHEITWAIASLAEGRLTALGASRAAQPRPEHLPDAAERAAVANEADVEVIVSIGLNRSTRPARAVRRPPTSAPGATCRSSAVRSPTTCSRGPSPRSARPTAAATRPTVSILRLSRAPAVVLEPGFLTNPDDARR
jgi:N-acetylmuramoyl-L-alanine amidase